METQLRNKFKKTSISVFVLVLLALLMPISAQAAKLPVKKETIGIGCTTQIELTKKNTKATYTYKSSNKKVATVSKTGKITGISDGKAKVTIKETLNKKTSTVGTFSITVKKASVYDDYKEYPESICTQPSYVVSEGWTYLVDDYIQYKNPKATYSWKSGDTSLLKITKQGKITDVKKNKNATVKLYIKENFNKKTRTVGYILVELTSPKCSLNKQTKEIAIGETFNLLQTIYSGKYLLYTSSKSTAPKDVNKLVENGNIDTDESVDMIMEDDIWTGNMKGVKFGKTYVFLYMYDYDKQKFTDMFSKFTINVKEFPKLTSLMLSNEFYGEDDTKEPIVIEVGDDSNQEIYGTPYNYTGNITVTSSNSEVADVRYIKSSDEVNADSLPLFGTVVIEGKKAGTTTINVKGKGDSLSFDVEVKAKYLRSGESSDASASIYTENFDKEKISWKTSSSLLQIESSTSNIGWNENNHHKFFFSYNVGEVKEPSEEEIAIYYDNKLIKKFIVNLIE